MNIKSKWFTHIIIYNIGMKVKISSLFFAAYLTATALSGCTEKKGEAPKLPAEVSVMEIGSSDAATGREYVGTVEESEGTLLSFEVPGNVVALKADEGDKVAKGQLLATVNPTSLRDAHSAAAAVLRQAQDAYKRMKPLHKQGVISDIKWVEVESKLSQAQAAERIAREQIRHTGLFAPFAGVIASRTAEKGMNVLAGQQIYKLVDISKVDVKISVPEKEISKIHTGCQAKVTVPALDGAVLLGTVTEKGVSADPVSHTYDVKITINNNKRQMMPGMVCNAELKTDEIRNEIVVPMNAVEFDSDNRRFVWVVENGKAAMRAITVGGFVGDGVVVASGLSKGDRVVVSGCQKVSEGMKVSVK